MGGLSKMKTIPRVVWMCRAPETAHLCPSTCSRVGGVQPSFSGFTLELLFLDQVSSDPSSVWLAAGEGTAGMLGMGVPCMGTLVCY